MRTSHDSDLLELELTRRRIPFVKYGGLRYLEAAHVKDFLALLRLADNGADEVAWFRVLQLVEGVGPVSARRAIDAMATGGNPTLETAAGEESAAAGGATVGADGDDAVRAAGESPGWAIVPDRLAAWPRARGA